MKSCSICLEQKELSTFSTRKDCCAICKVSFDSLGSKQIHVDHCHVSNKVRGVLCHHCNSMLGYARDNQDVLQEAVRYLNKTEYEGII